MPIDETAALSQMSADFGAQQAGIRRGAAQTFDDSTARFGPAMGRAQEALMSGGSYQQASMEAQARRAFELFRQQARQQGAQYNLRLGADAAAQADARTNRFLDEQRMLDQRLAEMEMKKQQAYQNQHNQLIGAGLSAVGGIVGGIYGGPAGATLGAGAGAAVGSMATGGKSQEVY